MSIITKPAEIYRGQKYTFVLSKADILALPKVSGHEYFSDHLNWNIICLFYRSDVGNQVETVSFHMLNGEILDGEFNLTSRARSSFEFRRMTIYDFDGGYLDIYREDFADAAVFDIGVDGEASGNFKPIISNFNEQPQIVATMVNGDSSARVGQGFTLDENKTVNAIQFRVSRHVSANTGIIIAKIYDINDVEVASSNNTIPVSGLSQSLSTSIFEFENVVLPAGEYYFKISTLAPLSHTLQFGGRTSDPYGSGQMFHQESWWMEFDLDFGVYEPLVAPL